MPLQAVQKCTPARFFIARHILYDNLAQSGSLYIMKSKKKLLLILTVMTEQLPLDYCYLDGNTINNKVQNDSYRKEWL